ncbi:MAG TPA: hypothetical protein VGD55_01210 [Acidothermaceae bacterium]
MAGGRQCGERGKIVGLVAVLDQYADAVEVDFLAHGVDLLDLWRGKLSVRRAWALIEHLGPGSALFRAVDPDAAAWSLTDHLLAEILHSSNVAIWQRSGDEKAPRPPRIVRPGVPDEVAASAARREARMRGFIERQRLAGVT